MADSGGSPPRVPTRPLRCGFLHDLAPVVDRARDSIHLRGDIDGGAADPWFAPGELGMLEEHSDDDIVASGGEGSWRGGARGGRGEDGGADARGRAAGSDAAGAGGDGARAGTAARDAADGRGTSASGGLGVDGVDGAQAGGSDGAHAGDISGTDAGGIDGADAEGVDGDGAIAVGASGIGADGDRSRSEAAAVGREGLGGAPGWRQTDGTTPSERVGRRNRVAADMFTKYELKTFFLEELRVTLGLTARQGVGLSAVRLQCRFINGAQVMVLTELVDPLTVWTAFADGTVLAFCSCGGVMAPGQAAAAGDIEPVDLQVALGESSTCRHAVALLEAYDCLCVDVRAGSLDELKRSFPSLLGSEEGVPVDEDDMVVFLAMRSGKRNNIPIYVVYHMGIWSPAVVWQQGNRHRLTTCCLLSCKTQPWACIHAKAFKNETRADRTSSSQAVADTVDTMRLGAEGILEDAEDGGGRDTAPPEAATAAAAAATLEASMRPRRARNMFPCAKEVEMCDRYAAFVEGEREAPGEFQFTDFLHVEDQCFECDERWTESTAGKPTLATLFTIRGRLAIVTKSWTCARGHNVAYDGSVDGLFAFRPETVYMRVFLDSIIELCVIARSTLAAASEFLTSFLRNTVAFAEVEPGQARQQLSDACGEFSDTLVVPKAAFVCHRCGEDEAVGGSFHCVVCDGQILSVLQAHVVAMLRPGMTAPRADSAMNFACAVRHASPRRVIRNRVRAKPTDVSALTRAEAEMWPLFAAVANGMPPAPPSLPRRGPPRTDTEKEAAALWAATTLVNTLFTVEEAQPARVAAAAAGIAGGEDGERLDDEEEDVVNLVEASDSEDGQGDGGRVHGERRVAGTGTDLDGSGDDSDGGRRAHVDDWVHAGSQRPAPPPAELPHAPRSSQ